jgi:hypothetical protein
MMVASHSAKESAVQDKFENFLNVLLFKDETLEYYKFIRMQAFNTASKEGILDLEGLKVYL